MTPDPAKPTITNTEARLRVLAAGAEAAEAAKRDAAPQHIAEAIIAGSLGDELVIKGRAFHSTTAGMFFADQKLTESGLLSGLDDLTQQTCRAFIHHQPALAYQLLCHGQTGAFVQEARDAFFDFTLEEMQRVAAWMLAEWSRLSPTPAGTATPPAVTTAKTSATEPSADTAENSTGCPSSLIP